MVPSDVLRDRSKIKKMIIFIITLIPILLFIKYVITFDFDYWNNFHFDSVQVWDIAVEHVPGWYSNKFNPFNDYDFQIYGFLMFILYYILSLWCFTDLTRRILNNFKIKNIPLSQLFLINFLLSYLVFGMISRMAIFIPIWLSAYIFLIFVIILSYKATIYNLKELRMFNFKAEIKSVFAIIVLFIFNFVWGIQSGRNFLVPDSDTIFLELQKTFYASRAIAPVINKQTDELYFNLIPSYFLGENRFALSYLLTIALFKTAFSIFVYVFAKSLLSNLVLTFLYLAFIFFGSNIIFPQFYSSLVGGQNPLLYLGHPGRYYSLIIFILFIRHLYLNNSDKMLDNKKINFIFWFLVLLLPTTYSNATFLIFLLLFGTLLYLKSVKILILAIIGTWVFIIFQIIDIFGESIFNYTAYFLIPISGFMLLRLFNSLPKLKLFSVLKGLLVVLLVIFLTGNIWSQILNIDTMGLHDFFNLTVYEYGNTNVSISLLSDSLCFNPPTPMCSDLKSFLAYNSTILLIFYISLILILFNKLNGLEFEMKVYLYISITYAFSIFLLFFTGIQDIGFYWVQTRFMEISFYVSFLLLLLIVSKLSHLKRIIWVLSLCLWILVSILSHSAIEQFIFNATYLLDRIPQL